MYITFLGIFGKLHNWYTFELILYQNLTPILVKMHVEISNLKLNLTGNTQVETPKVY